MENSFAVLVTICAVYSVNGNIYIENRNSILKKEASMRLGGNFTLSVMEDLVNNLLLQMKEDELNAAFDNPISFNPSNHFFNAKKNIERSKVFKFIQSIPKGGSLHSHEVAASSFEYMLELTYTKGLYVCENADGKLLLHFLPTSNYDCDWQLLEYVRAVNPEFDKYLIRHISLIVDDPAMEYPDISVVWPKFQDIFMTLGGLVLYLPMYKKYLYRVLVELYEDNVRYAEFRSALIPLYTISGTNLNETEIMAVIKEVADNFMESYKDFQYVKVIYAPMRNVDQKVMYRYVEIAYELRLKFGSFVAGFDLVGQEDLGKDLIDLIEPLELLQSTGINLVFHAGETNWFGMTDNNLIDAILLGTKRIGHGFAITKHPVLLQMIKDRNIAIELNPISNQVLHLIGDFRNHPGSFLVANGYPVVICNDDPAIWGTKALSYDWYEAFMGFTSKDDGLKVLKQFALNSYLYSLLDTDDKLRAIGEWENSWDRFIEKQYYHFFFNYVRNDKSLLDLL